MSSSTLSLLSRKQSGIVTQIGLVCAFFLALVYISHPSVRNQFPSLVQQEPDAKPPPEFQPPAKIETYENDDYQNKTMWEMAPAYIEAIMDPENESLTNLQCPNISSERWNHLQEWYNDRDPMPVRKYFFALDLHQAAHVLPRLMGSIIEVMTFLGPHSCVLSVVEGRSTDGTYEILHEIRKDIEDLGAAYFLTNKRIDPEKARMGKVKAFASLRNIALRPILRSLEHFDDDTTVIFLNDVAICPEDILELIHQKKHLGADMVCAMDWVFQKDQPVFRDVWVARDMTGDMFYDVPEDGSWDMAQDMFPRNERTQMDFYDGKAFQVFSCWNGAVAFKAKPILNHQIRFRKPLPDECVHQGEPKSFCKDLWNTGYGRIAVIPSVNVGYDEESTKKIKNIMGFLPDFIDRGTNDFKIKWRVTPPPKVKCVPSLSEQYWEEWDEALGV